MMTDPRSLLVTKNEMPDLIEVLNFFLAGEFESNEFPDAAEVRHRILQLDFGALFRDLVLNYYKLNQKSSSLTNRENKSVYHWRLGNLEAQQVVLFLITGHGGKADDLHGV